MDLIEQAINQYHQRTCVQFKRRTNEPNYISFTSDPTGCWSSVGRIGGKQVSFVCRLVLLEREHFRSRTVFPVTRQSICNRRAVCTKLAPSCMRWCIVWDSSTSKIDRTAMTMCASTGVMCGRVRKRFDLDTMGGDCVSWCVYDFHWMWNVTARQEWTWTLTRQAASQQLHMELAMTMAALCTIRRRHSHATASQPFRPR